MKHATKIVSAKARTPRKPAPQHSAPEVPSIQQTQADPILPGDPLYPRIEATINAAFAAKQAEREQQEAARKAARPKPLIPMSESSAHALSGHLEAVAMRLHAIHCLSRDVDDRSDTERAFAAQVAIEGLSLLSGAQVENVIRSIGSIGWGGMDDELARVIGKGVRHG